MALPHAKTPRHLADICVFRCASCKNGQSPLSFQTFRKHNTHVPGVDGAGQKVFRFLSQGLSKAAMPGIAWRRELGRPSAD